MSQTANIGQDIAYTRYNNGYIQSIHNEALGLYTYFEYDFDSNKTIEGYISLKNPVSVASGLKITTNTLTLAKTPKTASPASWNPKIVNRINTITLVNTKFLIDFLHHAF